MIRFLVAGVIALAATPSGTAWAGDHDPKPRNDTGCCASFDNSPVTLVFCTVPGSCTITPPK